MAVSKKPTLMAFIRRLCMRVTTGLGMFGITVEADALFVGAMIVLALGAYIWAWWKNNNVTTAATEAQKYLDELKVGVKPENKSVG